MRRNVSEETAEGSRTCLSRIGLCKRGGSLFGALLLHGTGAHRSCASPPLIWDFHLTPSYFQTHMEIIALPPPAPSCPSAWSFPGADGKKRGERGGQGRPHKSHGTSLPAPGGATCSQRHQKEGARPYHSSLWFPVSLRMWFSRVRYSVVN